MVISQFFPIIGGAEKLAQLLAKKLVEKGEDVTVVTGWWNLKRPQKEIINGIQVIRNFSSLGLYGMKSNKVIRYLGGITYTASLGGYLLMQGRKYDVIHVHQALYPSFVSVFIGKHLNKPVLVTSTSSGVTSDINVMRKFPFGYFQLKYLLKNMDCLVPVSKATGRDFSEIGFPESKAFYIPNGVDIPSHERPARDSVTRVLSTARLSQEKGIDVLLKAWPGILHRYPDLKLMIIGDGPNRCELHELTQSLRIEESVSFEGMVNNVGSFLDQADLFILPSRSEGMSNALLEAMSYGLPCVATSVGGNGELLGLEDQSIPSGEFSVGRNGLLVNSEDIDGLAKAILCLIQDQNLRREMGQKSRLFVQENHSIDLIADTYITLYQKILEKRSKHVWHLRGY